MSLVEIQPSEPLPQPEMNEWRKKFMTHGLKVKFTEGTDGNTRVNLVREVYRKGKLESETKGFLDIVPPNSLTNVLTTLLQGVKEGNLSNG